MKMIKKELLRGLEQILRISEGCANADTVLADHSAWDSMGIMEFIVLVDDQAGISLPAHQITACRTIGDLMKLCGAGDSD